MGWYIDDIKIFAKNEKRTRNTWPVYRNIRMEFGIKKCSMLIMKKRKIEIMEGIELPNLESIRTLEEKENDKYMRRVEVDTIKER